MNEAPEPYAVRTRTVHGTALRKRDVRHRTPCAVGGCKGTFIQGRNGRAARGLGFPKHRKSILKMYRIKWVNSIEMYRRYTCIDLGEDLGEEVKRRDENTFKFNQVSPTTTPPCKRSLFLNAAWTSLVKHDSLWWCTQRVRSGKG